MGAEVLDRPRRGSSLTDQPFNERQRWIELRIGSSDTRVVLFVFDEQGLKPGMMFNGALACDNVEQTYQELTAKGVEFTTPPRKRRGAFAVQDRCKHVRPLSR